MTDSDVWHIHHTVFSEPVVPLGLSPVPLWIIFRGLLIVLQIFHNVFWWDTMLLFFSLNISVLHLDSYSMCSFTFFHITVASGNLQRSSSDGIWSRKHKKCYFYSAESIYAKWLSVFCFVFSDKSRVGFGVSAKDAMFAKLGIWTSSQAIGRQPLNDTLRWSVKQSVSGSCRAVQKTKTKKTFILGNKSI